MNKERVLQQVGLTEAETKLYLVMLGSGEATASELARKTATNRTFTYDRLNKLVNAGLASHITKENKRYFKAAEPSQLMSILKERESQVQSILPELETLKAKTSEGPRVTVFSSKKGMQTALNLLLREKKPIFMQGSLLNFQNAMKLGFEVWNNRRIRDKLRLRLLTAEDATLDFAEIERLPSEEKTETTTFTCGDKTVIAFWSDVPVATLIESGEIAKNNVAFFKALWEREVRIYSGVDGIVKAFYELVGNKNGYYLGVGYSQDLAKVYGTKISDEWHKVRIENKVVARLISYDDSESVDYFNKRAGQWKDFKVKFLNRDVCGPTCATVSDNLMATFIYTEGDFKVILNKNKETINAYKKHFEKLWAMARS